MAIRLNSPTSPRRFRFSLRALFVLMTMAAVACGIGLVDLGVSLLFTFGVAYYGFFFVAMRPDECHQVSGDNFQNPARFH